MSTHKYIDRICVVILGVTLVLTMLFMNGEGMGITLASQLMGYESKLFDTSAVHSIDIIMEDWDGFISNCTSEEYSACTVVIDDETYKNVAIRGKGNTSLTQVASYGNDRYSFKIEFDYYDSGKTYYGLDKLCLNNIIQDNTYMKDYVCYQMMGAFGVASPLCSYVYITVNGEDWGLYLAVEGIEEAFLQRNYGKNYGELYKPDSQSMGGGRGNGENFNMEEIPQGGGRGSDENFNMEEIPQGGGRGSGENFNMEEIPQGGGRGSGENFNMEEIPQGGGTMEENGTIMGSEDVLLKYIDDEFDSYANIFDNAKTDISDRDKERLIAALKALSEGENISDTVDVEAVIRYFVVHNFVLNFDSYTGSMIHNYYLYEEDGMLSMIPWDYNLAFGGFDSAGDATSLVNYPIDTPVSGGSTADRPMLAWIFASEEYKSLYHQYFGEFISEYFDSGYFTEMMDTVSSMIAPYVEKDPTKFCTYEEFEAGVSTLREFCLLRAESISGQLEGAIGAASETQSEDSLIAADDITISDMGSMNQALGKDKGAGDDEAFPEPLGDEIPVAPDKLSEYGPGPGGSNRNKN